MGAQIDSRRMAAGTAPFRTFELAHYPVSDPTVLTVWEADDTDVMSFLESLKTKLADRS
jgi:hypothetical protein